VEGINHGSRLEDMMTNTKIRFINPNALPKPNGYTHVVEVQGGKTVYLSGQVALGADGTVVGEGDFEAQARQTFRNIQAGLEVVGLDFSHVVKLNLYVLNISNLLTLRQVRDEFVNLEHPPASTLVQVAALFRPEFVFEADAIAVAPE
jgi:enamine deaminase RidA (YjgF/YER057c/UK114 family)